MDTAMHIDDETHRFELYNTSTWGHTERTDTVELVVDRVSCQQLSQAGHRGGVSRLDQRVLAENVAEPTRFPDLEHTILGQALEPNVCHLREPTQGNESLTRCVLRVTQVNHAAIAYRRTLRLMHGTEHSKYYAATASN